jgi:site-specific DNA recombinase
MIRKFCIDNNYSLKGVYSDLGISGTLYDREGLNGIYNEVRRSNAIIVLVVNTSRLWRDDTAKVFIKRELIKLKAQVISIEQKNYNLYAKEPNDFLINGFMELLDQYDRLSINMKLANGRRQKAIEGIKACGSAPLGYTWISKKNRAPHLVINRGEAIIVRAIFTQYLKKKSIQRVALTLEEKQYLTRSEKSFSSAGIAYILKNRFYIGEVSHSDIRSSGLHEPLISKVIFRQVQSLLKKNNKNGGIKH